MLITVECTQWIELSFEYKCTLSLSFVAVH